MLLRSVLRRILGLRRVAPAGASQLCTAAPTKVTIDGNPEPSDPEPVPSEPDLEAVAAQLGLDDADKQRLHLLMLEYTELQLSGGRAADHIPADEWYELLLCPTFSARRKYHNYLFKTEKARESDRLAKLKRQMEHKERLRDEEALHSAHSQHLLYRLGHNTIFHRISQASLNDMMDVRLYQAMRFGQPLVFDLGFETEMKRRENKNAASQLHTSFSLNRASRDPFDLHFTSWDPEGEVSYFLHKLCPTISSPSFPLHLHQQDHLSIFPRDKLVYLTPHCHNDLETFDYDAIYIVGGLVDLGDSKPLTLAKAKREGIKMARLPLAKHLNLGPGFDPCLTLTAMMSILLELRASSPTAGTAAGAAAAAHSWRRALQHVPQRGLLSPQEMADIAARRSLRRTRNEAALLGRQRRWQRDSAAARPDWLQDDAADDAEPARCADPYLERRRRRPASAASAAAAAPARPAAASRLRHLLADLAADPPPSGRDAAEAGAPAATAAHCRAERTSGGPAGRAGAAGAERHRSGPGHGRRAADGGSTPVNVASGTEHVADSDLFPRAPTSRRAR